MLRFRFRRHTSLVYTSEQKPIRHLRILRGVLVLAIEPLNPCREEIQRANRSKIDLDLDILQGIHFSQIGLV